MQRAGDQAASRAVTVYVAEGCHLCEAALEVVRSVCGEDFAIVDITGDPELEAGYRASVPVVEVGGVRAFTYFVTPDGLRSRLDGQRRSHA